MGDRVILPLRHLETFLPRWSVTFRPELRDVPMAVCGSESDRHGNSAREKSARQKGRAVKTRADRLAGALALSAARMCAASYG